MKKIRFKHYSASIRLYTHLLTALAFLANLSAQIGAGTASSWNKYQPELPQELRR